LLGDSSRVVGRLAGANDEVVGQHLKSETGAVEAGAEPRRQFPNLVDLQKLHLVAEAVRIFLEQHDRPQGPVAELGILAMLEGHLHTLTARLDSLTEGARSYPLQVVALQPGVDLAPLVEGGRVAVQDARPDVRRLAGSQLIAALCIARELLGGMPKAPRCDALRLRLRLEPSTFDGAAVGKNRSPCLHTLCGEEGLDVTLHRCISSDHRHWFRCFVGCSVRNAAGDGAREKIAKALHLSSPTPGCCR
jgi:hypothetical protein